MVTYVDVARRVLQDAGGPLNPREIVDRAGGPSSFPGTKTPDRSMWSRIHEEMKRRGEKSVFVKAGGGKFDLRGSGQEGRGPGKDEESEYTTNPLYVGAAGEHRVESELLFREYDASMTSVDRGIDIVARKGKHVFDIQVKTMGRRPAGSHITSIKKETFDSNRSQSMYYVFVLKNCEAVDFVVLPFSAISKCIKERHITENKGGRYQVNFHVHDDGRITIKDEDVTFYKNNWNLGQLG